LIIKPLSNALRDGDNIRALIRGTGVNSDGRTPGILKPNLNAQVRLIRETYKRFGLDPSLTRYFEAHATGTQIGDSLEAESIATAFSQEMRGAKPLIVGALKTNIGHLEGASGLAGVIKTILVLENSLIPPNVWLDKLNPAVKEEWALTYPTRLSSFPIESRRRASVNSFGFGGTNAHAILDDAETFFEDKDLLQTLQWHPPSDSPTSLSSSPILLTWSAADESGVARQLEAFGVYFQKASCTEGLGDRTKYLYDLAYTLSLRRAHFSWRSFSICSSFETLCDLNFAPVTRVSPSLQCSFIFSSEGALWESMGQELMSYDCFRKSMEHSDILLRELGCQFSLLGITHDLHT
jgi:acyl transferase domain-containing protein